MAKIIVTSVTMKDKELLKVNKNETKKKKKKGKLAKHVNRHITQEETQMANKDVKAYSTLPIIRKMQFSAQDLFLILH